MAKTPKILAFAQAKGDAVENIEAIILSLSLCIDEGMIDLEDGYYNQLLTLRDEAQLSEGWDELMEVVTKAKTLEIDVAVWLSSHGKTSISLPWPKRPVS